MDFKKIPCDVGMHFGKREKSVKILNNSKLCMPSGKRWMHSVSGRNNNGRCNRRFPEGIHSFLSFPIFTDLNRRLTELAKVH